MADLINISLCYYTHYKPLKSQIENLVQFIFALDSNPALAQMLATIGNKLSLAQTLVAARKNSVCGTNVFLLLTTSRIDTSKIFALISSRLFNNF